MPSRETHPQQGAVVSTAGRPMRGDPACGDPASGNKASQGRSAPDEAGSPLPADAELIAASTAGDQHAFGQLVVRYQDRLYGSLLRMTNSAEDAQDIAQEAFVQAYLKINTFGGRSAFYTWLYRIAFNRCVSRSRKKRERTSLDALRESAAVDPVDPSAAPDAPIQATERAELLHHALAQLSEEHRQVMVLREMDGLDYQQIAEVLGVPVGTIRSRLFRARLQLKEKLASVLGETETAASD